MASRRNTVVNAVSSRKTASKENIPDQSEHTRGGHEHRPSDKVVAQKQAEADAAQAKAQQAEHRAIRKKKALQQQRQQAELSSDGEGEYNERPDAQFTLRTVTAKPATLAYQKSKVPAAPFGQGANAHTTSDESEGEGPSAQGRSHQHEDRRPSNVSHSRLGSLESNGTVFHLPSRDSAPPASRTPSHLPSPQVGNKQRHDEDVNVNIELSLLKAQKINNNTSRPKAADYDDTSKEVILAAANSYHILLAVRDAFPDSATDNGLAKEAWAIAVKETGCALALSPNIVCIIKARSSQVRGEAKSKTTALVEALYGFDSGNGRRVMAENRKRAEELKHEKGFLYRVISDDGEWKGIYAHPIIQHAINAMWFKNCRDEGIIFTNHFQPMPIPAIALILTAIECNIDEWLTGTKMDVTFWADEYRSIYNSHITLLTEFGAHTKSADLLGHLQHRLYNYGCHHAGAPPAEHDNVRAIPISAFAAALKEYEEDSTTDSEGEMMML